MTRCSMAGPMAPTVRAQRRHPGVWLTALFALTAAGVGRGNDSPTLMDGPLPPAAAIDHVIVDKSERELQLLAGGSVVRRYAVALGGNPRGHKQREGDRRTPEGTYLITARNPDSAYHLSLKISYPSLLDTTRAWQRGQNPGGQIMIHGIGDDRPDLARLHGRVDWTDGCIAVTNREIEEIWRLVREGTPIQIRP